MNTFKKRPLFLASALLMGMSVIFAQDNLVNSLKVNASENSKDAFKFTDVINLENTSIKNQGSSGTCWSYSGNSYVESEMIRMGKKPIDIAEMFTVRNMYIDKAEAYVRMHGGMSYGQGGAPHDPIDLMMKYGALPQELYNGLLPGQVEKYQSRLSSLALPFGYAGAYQAQ